ncbi:MAG: UDP-3-O-(3-hydroxymyristoyl)glucosamine N-acyltransferase [Victivallales bacterium]|nr:UDP-3-O-(3-hydroxymyristoyl)glucosamine N-acyltransferase [Victivallales bacterium]
MSKKYTAKELAELLNGELIGNEHTEISGVSGLENATGNELSFLNEKNYYKKLAKSKAGVVIIPHDIGISLADDKSWIKCENPTMAFSKVIELFAPPIIEYPKTVHPAAVVAESAEIGKNCHIGANAVIGENARIGNNTNICAGAVICENVEIGENCLIYHGVVIRDYCELGNNVIIHPNTTIGADGFGYNPTPMGWVKIPQRGIVKIEDDVEVGANTTIDRSRFGKTWIKTGVKIDNLVDIAHNCTVGEFTVFAGQSGVAGSTDIGQGVIVAARAAINGHITIGDGARVAPCSAIKDNMKPGEELIGVPAQPPRDFGALLFAPKSIERLKKKIKELEKTVKKLQEDSEK